MPEGTNGPVQIPTEDVAGSIAARQVLGADSEQAVIAAFLERTGYAIDARVDARFAVAAATRPEQRSGSGNRDPAGVLLALGSMVIAIPLTGIATQFSGAVALFMIAVAWVGIILVNVAYHRNN